MDTMTSRRKRITSVLIAVVMFVTMLQFEFSTTANTVVRTLTNQNMINSQDQRINGFDFESWRDSRGEGQSIMTIYSNGAFNGTYSQSYNTLFRTGRRFPSNTSISSIGNISLSYTATNFASGRNGGTNNDAMAYLCVYGWSDEGVSANNQRNNLVEWYIVEDWLAWSPVNNDGTPRTGYNRLSSFTVDGATYDVIVGTRDQQPSIYGTQTFLQIFSIRRKANARRSGTINVSAHFAEWARVVQNVSSGNRTITFRPQTALYEVMFCVEGYGGDQRSNGSGNVTQLCIRYGNNRVCTDNGCAHCGNSSGTTGPTTPTTAATTNSNGYFFHSNFEGSTTSVDGWSPRGDDVVITNSGSRPYAGTRSLHVTGRSDYWHGVARSLSSTVFRPGTEYTFSAMAMYQSGAPTTDFALTLQYDVGEVTNWANVATATATAGQWVQLTDPAFLIPAGATNMTLYIEADVPTLEFFVDELIGAPRNATVTLRPDSTATTTTAVTTTGQTTTAPTAGTTTVPTTNPLPEGMIYNMQRDATLTQLAGTGSSGSDRATAVLRRVGSPDTVLTVNGDFPEPRSFVVTGREGTSHGAQIQLRNLEGIDAGVNYEISVDGKFTANGDGRRARLRFETGSAALAFATPSSDGTFRLSHIVSGATLLAHSLLANPVYSIGCDSPSGGPFPDMEITGIVILRTDAAVTTTTATTTAATTTTDGGTTTTAATTTTVETTTTINWTAMCVGCNRHVSNEPDFDFANLLCRDCQGSVTTTSASVTTTVATLETSAQQSGYTSTAVWFRTCVGCEKEVVFSDPDFNVALMLCGDCKPVVTTTTAASTTTRGTTVSSGWITWATESGVTQTFIAYDHYCEICNFWSYASMSCRNPNCGGANTTTTAATTTGGTQSFDNTTSDDIDYLCEICSHWSVGSATCKNPDCGTVTTVTVATTTEPVNWTTECSGCKRRVSNEPDFDFENYLCRDCQTSQSCDDCGWLCCNDCPDGDTLCPDPVCRVCYPAETCDTCAICMSGEPPKIGFVLGAEKITVSDALEILKHIVGLGNVIDECDYALTASLIVSETKPTTVDALEILKYIVGLPNKITDRS